MNLSAHQWSRHWAWATQVTLRQSTISRYTASQILVAVRNPTMKDNSIFDGWKELKNEWRAEWNDYGWNVSLYDKESHSFIYTMQISCPKNSSIELINKLINNDDIEVDEWPIVMIGKGYKKWQ